VRPAYDEISETLDRSWTFPLLERLASGELPDDERDRLVDTLCELEDWRAVEPLTRLLEDRGADVAAREDAGGVLRCLGPELDPVRLRRWWTSGDGLLQEFALVLGAGDAPLVEAIASDPRHPLHEQGIRRMAFGFGAPRFQALKIAALGHADPLVREAAADALVWDEPVAAEGPLLGATADPVVEVAVAAADALRHYPSRRVLEHLDRLRREAAEPLREMAGDSFTDLRGSFLSSLLAAGPLRGWMAPVLDLLAFSAEELHPVPDRPWERPPSRRQALPAEVLLRDYTDPDGPWADRRRRLRDADWTALADGDRARLRPWLRSHPDPFVRESACRAFADWDDADGLLALLCDPQPDVRRAAAFHLAGPSPRPWVAAITWEHLSRADVTGVHASETLRSYVRHADRADWVPRLTTLVLSDEREDVRTTAVGVLSAAGAAEAVASLLGLLEQPPDVTWAVHIALLAACDRLELAPPGLDALAEVDNLHLAEALVPHLGEGG
jgi:HEAT repeat protein